MNVWSRDELQARLTGKAPGSDYEYSEDFAEAVIRGLDDLANSEQVRSEDGHIRLLRRRFPAEEYEETDDVHHCGLCAYEQAQRRTTVKIPMLTPEQLGGEEGRQVTGSPAWWRAQEDEARARLGADMPEHPADGCATTGCASTRAPYELAYSWPRTRDQVHRVRVCETCAHDYLRRTVIRPCVRPVT